MGTTRFKAAIRVLFSASGCISLQKRRGQNVETFRFGKGDITDLVLMARAMKQSYDGFSYGISQMAAEAGELHALEEIKAALDAMEHENGGE